jgi:hypothetical protein
MLDFFMSFERHSPSQLRSHQLVLPTTSSETTRDMKKCGKMHFGNSAPHDEEIGVVDAELDALEEGLNCVRFVAV